MKGKGQNEYKRPYKVVYSLSLLQRNLRAIPIDLDGVDSVLGQASCLQEWTVFAHLHTLACEVISIKQLHSVVLSMLWRTIAHQHCSSSELSFTLRGGVCLISADTC